MYICIYVYMYICIYVFMYLCIYVYVVVFGILGFGSRVGGSGLKT